MSRLTDSARAERRAILLDATEALLAERPFATLPMADVAAAGGVAKGTVFLYFPTKEALGLALVERHLGEWFGEVDAALERIALRPLGASEGAPARRARRIADALAGAAVARPRLVELLAILGSTLEANVDEETARAFKTWLASRLAVTGAWLERALPPLRDGQGARALLVVNALVVGLHQMASPAPVVDAVLRDPALAPLRVNLATELADAIALHLIGLASRA
jgi:AcrR family transcriptional regulator